MRIAAILIIAICGGIAVFAQDGSDISYVAPAELLQSHVGRQLHIDFHRRSFAAFGNARAVDSIEVDLDGRKTRFVERRVDDGFNNWFREQYLESIGLVDGARLRIVRFELLKFGELAIDVRAHFGFFDANGGEQIERAFTRELTFAKKDIVELLFKASD